MGTGRHFAGQGTGREAELVTTRLIVSTARPIFAGIAPPIMTLRSLVFLPLAAALTVRAAGPLAPPAPLVMTAAATAPGEGLMNLGTAQGALKLGLPTQAAAMLEQLLAGPEAPGADHNTLVLLLTSARLAQGDLAAADKALHAFVGPPNAAWHLRAGMIAARQKLWPKAQVEMAAAPPEALAPDDRGWAYFLQYVVADALHNASVAAPAFQRAMDSAVSEAQRAQFTYARERSKITSSAATAAEAESYHTTAVRFAGQNTGYDFARLYAYALAGLGRRGEAVNYLQAQLRALPAADRTHSDDFRLLLGVIAGAESQVGRNALEGLLTDADTGDLQRLALQMLAAGSPREPERTQFRKLLNSLIDVPTRHPILNDLLLVRAEFALEDKDYAQAEQDAQNALSRLSRSPLEADALGLLARSAWEQRRYRSTADYATKAHAVLPPTDVRYGAFGVLVAEAWFRAGGADDFKSAADAYATAAANPPPGVAPGNLLFMQILAEIRGGQEREAGRLLDTLAGNPRLDPLNRWQAEWNLARDLMTLGAEKTAQAYQRVNGLMAAGGASGAVSAYLHVQMAWLQARLALDTGETETGLALAGALVENVKDLAGLEGRQRAEVAASAQLLEAQAYFDLKKPAEALATLGKLREIYLNAVNNGDSQMKSYLADAEMQSYLYEASYYLNINQLVEAERSFNELAKQAQTADDQTYGPYALYQAALIESRLGQDENLIKAIDIIEKQLIAKYPQSDLVFSARRKEGELLWKLGKYPEAQSAFEYLIITFPNHADLLAVQLALAICHQSMATDPGHYESAQQIYGRLKDQVNAPAALRIEAGYRLGGMYDFKGEADKALATWAAVVSTFLPATAGAAGPAPHVDVTANGRFWLGQTLIHQGEMLEKEKHLEEAVTSFQLVVANHLPFMDTANAGLRRLGATPPP